VSSSAAAPGPAQPAPVATATSTAPTPCTGGRERGPTGECSCPRLHRWNEGTSQCVRKSTWAKPSKPCDCAVASGAIADACEVCKNARPRLRACYDEALPRPPGMQGSVRLHAEVGPDGIVSRVAGGGGPLRRPIVPCLKSVVRTLAFAAPEGGKAIVTIPITFIDDSGQ